MAAYGKQQPPLNDAYYGPAIPPPPAAAYFGSGGPSAPRRSTPFRLFCCLFKIIAIVVIALGTATLVLWLVFRPSAVKAYAETATLSRFDLDAGGRGRNSLQYNLTVGMRVRNPNRFGINYGRPDAQAFYDGTLIAYDAVQPFYLDRKSEVRFTLSFNGTSPISDGDVEEYRKETRQGFYEIKVRVYADLDFKIRGFKINDHNSKITCKLVLPVPAGNGTASTTPTMVLNRKVLGMRCDVDF
ncbi:hypothetical protein ABZP36_014537 [Zizania latifolia]